MIWEAAPIYRAQRKRTYSQSRIKKVAESIGVPGRYLAAIAKDNARKNCRCADTLAGLSVTTSFSCPSGLRFYLLIIKRNPNA